MRVSLQNRNSSRRRVYIPEFPVFFYQLSITLLGRFQSIFESTESHDGQSEALLEFFALEPTLFYAQGISRG